MSEFESLVWILFTVYHLDDTKVEVFSTEKQKHLVKEIRTKENQSKTTFYNCQKNRITQNEKEL